MQLTPDGSAFETKVGADYTEQKIEQRFNFWLGEWFADSRLGMPYFREMLGQKTPLPVIRSMFWRALELFAGVSTIVEVNVDFDEPTRALSIGFKVILVDGSVLNPEPFIVRV